MENRYDQSIFSILCKLRGITTLDGSETYAENWEQLSLFPFQDRRDMGIPRAGKKGWLEKCRQLLLSSKETDWESAVKPTNLKEKRFGEIQVASIP